MTARNGTTREPSAFLFDKGEEMSAYEQLPPDLREVIREAPFDVSVANMLSNYRVMQELRSLGDSAPSWLKQRLLDTYRTKILPQAFIYSPS